MKSMRRARSRSKMVINNNMNMDRKKEISSTTMDKLLISKLSP